VCHESITEVSRIALMNSILFMSKDRPNGNAINRVSAVDFDVSYKINEADPIVLSMRGLPIMSRPRGTCVPMPCIGVVL
jgi:hypothetical protein